MADFGASQYSVVLQKGSKGYGLQFEPTDQGPRVTQVFEGGEAERLRLVQISDLLVALELDNVAVEMKQDFKQLMHAILQSKSAKFTFKGQSSAF
mmetsp:Transcript_30992/g.72754  ORF Transcript_30992/g.72754 Transcript_30992/m.72754 type:complete len:95 (-) Transcript_30992:105-389(-)